MPRDASKQALPRCGRRAAWPQAALLSLALACHVGCAVTVGGPGAGGGRPGRPPEGGEVRIYSARANAEIPLAQLIAELGEVRIVYVGESHTDRRHHDFQLRLIRGLRESGAALAVGLEMFDRSYQPVLDRWSAGALGEEELLRQTHWYANWRYDYGLYRPILDYLRQEGIRIVALNLPFHIPPKIRTGGVDYLSAAEKAFLPAEVDTTRESHREAARRAFERHDFGGRTRFEDFYLAQCIWDEGMAEAVASGLGEETMVVLAGNGHIQYRHGIPERAARRNALPYRSVVLLAGEGGFDPEAADYTVRFD